MNAAGRPRWQGRAPTAEQVSAFLRAQATSEFSYAAIGASSGITPVGYNLDHNRIELGRGGGAYAAAADALQAWKMFPAPWTRITAPAAPWQAGQLVAMQARACGLWWLNACRIVYTIDEQVPVRRFGFAYGTLPAHVEEGEERFLVEWLPDDTVWYDLRAFSRPRYAPVRLAKPWARRLQRRFVRESQAAMVAAVQRAVANENQEAIG